MILEEELQELRPRVQCKNGQSIDLKSVQKVLQERSSKLEIPLAFYSDQIKYGGLLGSKEDCLVLYHPEHRKDYFSVVFRIKRQGDYSFITIDATGTSKLIKADAVRKQINATAKEGINYRGYNPLQCAVGGAAIVAAGIAGVRHFANKGKLEQEQEWYATIGSLIDNVVL